jgi:hypothetical protein
MVSRLDHLPIELPRLRDALLRELLDFDWNTRILCRRWTVRSLPTAVPRALFPALRH